MRLRTRTNMPSENSDLQNGDDIEAPQFDMKRFISEVETRPAIWDTTSRVYSDKVVKKRCWDELVDIFINKENSTQEDRNEYHKTLQRKWKSLRDCFNRECQRLKLEKQGIATSRKSQYTYYKNLTFLHKVMNKDKPINGTKNAEPTTNDTSNSTDASIISNNDTSPNAADVSSIGNAGNLSPSYAADTSPSSDQLTINDIYLIDDDDLEPECSTLRKPKKRTIEIELDDDEDSGFTKMLRPNVQLIEGKVQTTESTAKTLEDDSDRLFLLSLLEPLKQVPEKLRMSVRVKMMQVVDSAVRIGMSMPHH